MNRLTNIKQLLDEELERKQIKDEKLEQILASLSTISADIKSIKQPDELLDIKDVSEIIKFSTDWIYRHIRLGLFPAPIKINTASRWYRSEIDAWLELHKSYRVN